MAYGRVCHFVPSAFFTIYHWYALSYRALPCSRPLRGKNSDGGDGNSNSSSSSRDRNSGSSNCPGSDRVAASGGIQTDEASWTGRCCSFTACARWRGQGENKEARKDRDWHSIVGNALDSQISSSSVETSKRTSRAPCVIQETTWISRVAPADKHLDIRSGERARRVSLPGTHYYEYERISTVSVS